MPAGSWKAPARPTWGEVRASTSVVGRCEFWLPIPCLDNFVLRIIASGTNFDRAIKATRRQSLWRGEGGAMKGAAQQWIVGSVVAGVACAMVGNAAFGGGVTDADRIFKNYTRETATVAPQQFRIEVQGILQVSDGSTKVDLLGFRTLPNADQLSGGIFNLIASYGVTKGVEVGFVIPGYYQSL